MRCHPTKLYTFFTCTTPSGDFYENRVFAHALYIYSFRRLSIVVIRCCWRVPKNILNQLFFIHVRIHLTKLYTFLRLYNSSIQFQAYIRLTCRSSMLEMRSTSTAPNAIVYTDELERSTAGIITRAQALQMSSKTDAREYTTEKFKTLATTYRLEMMPILKIFQTL